MSGMAAAACSSTCRISGLRVVSMARLEKAHCLFRHAAVLAALISRSPRCAASGHAQSNIFGVVEGFWFPDVTCDLGVGWERIIFDWSQHQPEGPNDWYTLNVDDRWLKAANQCQREVVALLKNTPAWATDGKPGRVSHVACICRWMTRPTSGPISSAAAPQYYASRGVEHFIIWNEPDIAPETYGFEFEGRLRIMPGC